MTEELYIINGEQRISLDLNVPSGITLKYSSNLFTDLSKITASHSYTFKLPLTENNRRAFDLADDVRHTSKWLRKKISCEYCCNGVPVITNGYIYLSSIEEGSYQAVLTWDVAPGLQKIKEENVSLRELRKLLGNDEELTTDVISIGPRGTSFNNTEKIQYPLYNCGAQYYQWYWNAIDQNDYKYSLDKLEQRPWADGESMPVMPVKYILSMINKAYGTKFELGEEVSWGASDAWTIHDPITLGLIPLVGRELTDAQIEEMTLSLHDARCVDISWDGSRRLIYFVGFSKGSLSDITPVMAFDNKSVMGYSIRYAPSIAVDLDGIVTVLTESKETSTLYVSAIKADNSIEDLASMKPTEIRLSEGYGFLRYYHIFDFRKSAFRQRLSVDNNGLVNHQINIDVGGQRIYNVSGEVKVYLDTSDMNIHYDCDAITNLPDISCLDFVKSLFFMIGAFPKLNKDGSITAGRYADILYRYAKDWSDKVIDSTTDLPENTAFTIDDMAQSNYYLMGNDDPEKSDKEIGEQKDVYAKSWGVIKIDNAVAEKKKDIYKAPWYSRYIRNTEYGYLPTGDTIKAWTPYYEEGWAQPKYKEATPKPAYCIAYQQPLSRHYTYEEEGQLYHEYEFDEYNKVFSLQVYEPFKNMDGYTYLQKILNDVHVIKEKLLLTELDLVNIDYTIPVYIEKYNSYFAIISIEANMSNGYVTAELIKLPPGN